MIVMNAGSIVAQLMNVFFLSSGLFTDLLAIRICLTMAYLCLLISGLLGLPSMTEPLFGTGRIAPDVIVWAIVNIVVVHGSGVIRMFYDERAINFETEELEMLWRFFYRHSGLSKAQFLDLIVPHVKLKTYREGEYIPCSNQFNIILNGTIHCDAIHHDNKEKKKVMLASGEMFPLIHIYKHFMPHKSFFHRLTIQRPLVKSRAAKVFTIPLKDLEEMVYLRNAKIAWTAMIIAALSEIAEREFRAAQGRQTGGISISRNALTVNPQFGELEPHEEPNPLRAGSGQGRSHPIAHAWEYFWSSMSMPWPIGTYPVGLRHSLPPPRHEGTLDTRKNAMSLRNIFTGSTRDLGSRLRRSSFTRPSFTRLSFGASRNLFSSLGDSYNSFDKVDITDITDELSDSSEELTTP